ncbi:MAG: universal stress protein [Armatimonadota bacterium]
MTNERHIRKILVATDGSRPSMRGASYAVELAACTSAEVVLLNVMEVTGVTQFVTYSVSSGDKDLRDDLHSTGTDIIERTREPFKNAGISVHAKILEGYAAETILTEARDGGYDLIIMGSCGMGAGLVQRVVFGVGSVAERVVANAPCPVLVMRGKE